MNTTGAGTSRRRIVAAWAPQLEATAAGKDGHSAELVSSCEFKRRRSVCLILDVLGRIAVHSMQQLEELFPDRWAAPAK